MLAHIEAPLFFFSIDAEPDHGIDDFQNDECSRKRKGRSRNDRDSLDSDLGRVSREQAFCSDRGEQPGGKDAEDSADSVMSSSESS
jgi:hypothetical protein